jgi:hypothetical protein
MHFDVPGAWSFRTTQIATTTIIATYLSPTNGHYHGYSYHHKKLARLVSGKQAYVPNSPFHPSTKKYQCPSYPSAQ